MADQTLSDQSGRRTEIRAANGVTIRFDAVLRISHSFPSIISSQPIEDGSIVSDHVTLGPNMLSLEAMISDHPVGPLPGEELPGATDPAQLTTRSKQYADELVKLRDKRDTLTVITTNHVYKNMVIESLSWDDQVSNGEAIAFMISMKEIIKAKVALVTIDKLATTEGDLAAGKVNLGNKKTKRSKRKAVNAKVDGLKKKQINSLTESARLAKIK